MSGWVLKGHLHQECLLVMNQITAAFCLFAWIFPISFHNSGFKFDILYIHIDTDFDHWPDIPEKSKLEH